MLNEEDIPEFLEAARHYERTKEIRDCLLIGFSQEGVWVGLDGLERKINEIIPRGIGKEYLGFERTTRKESDGSLRLLSSYYYQKGEMNVPFPHKIEFDSIAGELYLQAKHIPVIAPKLKKIGKGLYCYDSQKIQAPLLEEIGGNMNMRAVRVLDTPKLKTIGADYYGESLIKANLPCLESIGGDVFDDNRKKLLLPSLRSIGKSLRMELIGELDLSSLQEVGGDFITPLLKDLKAENLEKVGGILNISHVGEVFLPTLRTVGKIFAMEKTTKAHLENLQSIGGDLKAFKACDLKIPKLRELGGKLQLHSQSYEQRVEILKRLNTTSLKKILAQDKSFSFEGNMDKEIQKELARRELEKELSSHELTL